MSRFLRPTPLASRPRVSVVVPCYRYGNYLPACVRSILDQPGVDVDVLIVDDASPDDSADVARALAAADPRVRVIVHETNKRHIATYNEGLSLVDGEYAVLLSADDMLAPGSLARAVAVMEANPRVGMVYGRTPHFQDAPPTARTRTLGWRVWSGTQWLEAVARSGHNPVINPEVVMRRRIMVETGYYDPSLPYSGDMELWLRAALVGDIAYVVGPDQGFYRTHGQNMHIGQFGRLLDDLTGRRQAFDTIFERHAPVLVPGRDLTRLHRLSRRAVAGDALLLATRALDERREGAVDLARAYRDFARETYPRITGTLLDRRLAARLSGGDSGPSAGDRAVRGARILRDKVRWRRWRLAGI